MEEAIVKILEDESRGSIAPLMILMIVTGFQLLSGWLEFLRKVHSYSFPNSND